MEKQPASAVVVIQARLGSQRLPRKVLRELSGKPMLDQIINQVAGVRGAVVALAASDAEADEALVDFARSRGVTSIRGPADDVIGRMARAARATKVPEATIRVWGDCPFVCPDIIEAMLDRFFENRVDFMNLGMAGKRTLPVGLDAEIYRTHWLLEADRRVLDAYLREFPFELVTEQGETFRWDAFTPESPFGPDLQLTVDYPEDLVAAECIYEALGAGRRPFSSADLFEVLARRPELLNRFASRPRQADFKQKSEMRRARQ